MSRYNDIIGVILANEGLKGEDPWGGKTILGISEKWHAREHAKIEKILKKEGEKAAIEEAKRWYKTEFYEEISGDKLPKPVALLVMDTAVLFGIRDAAKMLQREINKIAAPILKVDGCIGPKTLMMVNIVYRMNPALLLMMQALHRIEEHTDHVDFEKYGRGWIKRTTRTLAIALDWMAQEQKNFSI